MNNKILITLTIIFFIFGLSSLLYVIVSLLLDSNYFHLFGKIDLERSSHLGEFIGGFIGIFWTAAGLLMLIITFNLQRNQLKSQTNEFIITQFESNFFNLLNHLNQIIISTSGAVQWANIRDGNVSGRKYLYYAIREFSEQFSKNIKVTDPEFKYRSIIGPIISIPPDKHRTKEDFQDYNFDLFREYIQEIFKNILNKKESQLNHYYKFVISIIEYVHNSQLKSTDKQKYIKLLEAQMTNDELWLIFFYALMPENISLFNLLEKYNFLENLTKSPIDWYDIAMQLYEKTIFKNYKK